MSTLSNLIGMHVFLVSISQLQPLPHTIVQIYVYDEDDSGHVGPTCLRIDFPFYLSSLLFFKRLIFYCIVKPRHWKPCCESCLRVWARDTT